MNIKQKLVRTGYSLVNAAKAHSPEILMVAGTTSIVVGAVMACKATLKAGEVLEDHEMKLKQVKEAETRFSEDEYSESDKKHDIAITYAQTGFAFAKLYGPSVVLIGSGLAMMCGSNRILTKRNMALTAAYEAVDKAFKVYRAKVVADLGEDKDLEYRYGLKKDDVVIEEDVDGESKTSKLKDQYVIKVDEFGYSEFARWFDESSRNWSKDVNYNLAFLKAKQAIANDMLHARGVLTLNEVYQMLDIPTIPSGQLLGWYDNGDCTKKVDFGIWNCYKQGARDFVNGYTNVILLDFNIDSEPVWDKI